VKNVKFMKNKCLKKYLKILSADWVITIDAHSSYCPYMVHLTQLYCLAINLSSDHFIIPFFINLSFRK